MKIFKHVNGFYIKRKNKRLVIKKADKPEELIVQIATFEKGKGHFALTEDRRGMKVLTMKLSHETAQILSKFITLHLEDQNEAHNKTQTGSSASAL